ncbi:LysR substrate-binding domain-containing protein [Sphingobium sp. AP49]|uniref:LysR substrate-binding domain-containing protein n=1 Tax=Sphingobium sp. AP49 TaxID=1144307 RepID=UPI00026ED564|nr:LysR substrate-binding domain-containing protein [Sphingobium sp. AP49]WHO38666.1 LysR substrate-binding domain-containing protein [Sphingobium sp. AP49]
MAMDLDDLRSFAQVVRHGGFSAAERATGERKAKLSRRVARLEQALGIRLIERSTRNLRVTDVGREIYRQCETIAESIDAAEAIAARSRSQVSGNLRVSCPPGLARYLGTDVFARFLTLYPDVHLEMHITSQRVDLIQERFDAAFRVDIDATHDQTLTMRQLGRLDRILVAAPDLAMQAAAVTIAALATLPTLSVGEHIERDEWPLVDARGHPYALAHHPRFCSNDSAVVRDAAVAGLGVALLSSMACSIELQQGRLVHILPDWKTSEGIVHVVFTTRTGMSPTLRAFIDYVAESFPALTAGAPA